jgi:AmmeMemoRadiSam system protein B
MTSLRQANVAGSFYPANPAQLRADIDACYRQRAQAEGPERADGRIKALIVPHAGLIYSGPIAASAYASIAHQAADIRRVVLLGPSHRLPFHGLALCAADGYETPLGVVPIARAACDELLRFAQVQALDTAFDGEHCLEVQLPFLQQLLSNFELIPLLVGTASAAEVAEVLESLWGGDETLILISSDLSHFLDDQSARALDARTAAAILRLQPEAIGSDQACGRYPMAGLLQLAKARGLKAEQLDLRNSSETAGPRDRVVGYGAYAFR